MIRNFFIASVIIFMASCSSTRPTAAGAKKPATTRASSSHPNDNKKDIKFLDEISANPNLASTIPDTKTEQKETAETLNKTKFANNSVPAGDISALKIKYAELLGKDPNQLDNIDLLRSVDE